jgi:hypothetical protein
MCWLLLCGEGSSEIGLEVYGVRGTLWNFVYSIELRILLLPLLNGLDAFTRLSQGNLTYLGAA